MRVWRCEGHNSSRPSPLGVRSRPLRWALAPTSCWRWQELEPRQLQTAVSAIASTMPALEDIIKDENKLTKVVKKEAFVNGFSIGVCKNDSCLCAACECGASCQCNIGSNTGVEQDGTCEPCGAFRAEKAAEAQRQKKQK